jgi:hypothetical protein
MGTTLPAPGPPGPPVPPATPGPPPTPADGATYADVLTRLSTVSSKISDILRTLGIGTVVFCWGLFTADKGLAHDVAVRHRIWIVVTAAIAIVGLLFDLLQAVFNYWVANRLRYSMEYYSLGMAPYPYSDWRYRVQTAFFAIKSVLMPVATASIVALLFLMVRHPQKETPPTPGSSCSPVPVTVTVTAPVTPPTQPGPVHRHHRKKCPCTATQK